MYQSIQILMMILLAVIAAAVFLALCLVNWKQMAENMADRTADLIEDRLKQAEGGYFSYRRLDGYLHAMGIYEAFGEEAVNPVSFLILKCAVTLILFTVGYSLYGWILALPVGILGFFLLDLLIQWSNDSDNEEMMPDLKRVFDTLRIQTAGSVHLSNALLECYLVVSFPRLKKELQRLSVYILATNDMDGAIMRLNREFHNRYINSLCTTLIQALENGNSIQLLEDLSNQIADMQAAMNLREQERINRKVQRYELLLFAGILVFCIYTLAVNMSSGVAQF